MPNEREGQPIDPNPAESKVPSLLRAMSLIYEARRRGIVTILGSGRLSSAAQGPQDEYFADLERKIAEYDASHVRNRGRRRSG